MKNNREEPKIMQNSDHCWKSLLYLDRLNTFCECSRCKEVRREDEQKRHKYKGKRTRYSRARRRRRNDRH